jgi:isoquinoline 1-oxidoreductase beta subunit
MPMSRQSHQPGSDPAGRFGAQEVGRRRFLGYVVGAGTLVAAAELGLLAEPARAVIPSGPQIAELYDLNDLLTDAARPTANLITVTIDEDGGASFALPRAEVGQGITTSIAMLIAEELELPLDKVRVTLAPARPELVWNQITGGSNTIVAMYTPVRVAAAIAKGALLEAAAIQLGDTVGKLVAKGGVITGSGGGSATYAELTRLAASPTTVRREVELKPASEFSIIGTPQGRKDALDAVTGRKKFAMDLDVPGALPAMVCRPPELNGTVRAVRNEAEVKAMPGVTHVVTIPTGVAVRAHTFGQCIDAIRALDVEWNPGSVTGESDETVLARLRKAELPLAVPKVPLLAKTVESDVTFYFRSGSPLETNCAVADVRADRAELWGGAKNPITAQELIAAELKMLPSNVGLNVVESGGSFGRKLFHDGLLEAAQISKLCQAPVRLMWHRADEPRQGRMHPMATSRIRATHLAGEVLSFEQRYTGVWCDFSHGFGEIVTAMGAKLPMANLGYAQTIFTLTTELGYNFGVVTQLMNESDQRFNTSAVRNVYSPDVRCASELAVDKLAKAMGKDPLAFRRTFIKTPRLRRVLDKVAEVGQWGRAMPAGTAQGIAIHKEYKGVSACLVEIDCRPETVNRKVYNGVAGPRVTKVVYAIDPGLVINPRGVEAQMQGGIMDGIGLALTASAHLEDGHFLEASWDNYFYTRQWNVPPDVQVIVMPSDVEEPGGAGEAGVAASFAAVACAYARATGTQPTYFPVNHRDPIGFEVKSFVPPVPASPTDGLDHTF